MQRFIYSSLSIVMVLSASALYAADPDSSGGTSSSAPPTLPETQVIGQPEAPAAPAGPGGPGTNSVFSGTMFQSPPTQGYSADSSTTGTLIDVPQIDVPATVSVVPQAVLSDQQVLTVDDVLRDVPSAIKQTDNDLRLDAFILRGFLVTSRDFRKDGFLDPTYTPRDFANVDRVEILQGPGSGIYGAGQPSGTVNLITKQPLANPMQTGSMQFGSFGLERYTIDSTGPMNQDGSLLYRVNADYQKNESFRDFGYNEGGMVAPAVTWVIDRDTTLTWESEFVNDRRRYDTGVAAVNDQLTLPISRFLGEPTDFQHFQDYRESLVLNHRINDDWSLKVGGYSLFYNAQAETTVPAAEVGTTSTFLRMREDINPFNEQYQSVIAAVAGKIEIGGMLHHVAFGTEEGWFTSNAFTGTSSSPLVTPLPIDADNPTYGTVPPGPIPAEVYNSTFYQADYGVYFQDLIDLTEHWKFLAGVRYDHSDVIFNRSLTYFGFPIIPPTKSVEQFDVGTPRFGLIYEPIPEQVSIYGMYSASFDPPDGGPYLETTPLQPEFGQLWEFGIKVKATDRLTLAAAAFHIAEENVTVYAPDGFHVSQVGGQRSDGVQLSAMGKVTDRLSLLASYSYTDTELFDPTPGSVINGQRALGVPYNSANAWARYNLIADPCRTLGVGLGLVYAGDRSGDYYSPLTLPSYTRCDAGVFYHHNRLDVNLYVENVFDTVYYTSSINQFEVFPGAPINVKGQMTLRF